jgi:hypothetical protein
MTEEKLTVSIFCLICFIDLPSIVPIHVGNTTSEVSLALTTLLATHGSKQKETREMSQGPYEH